MADTPISTASTTTPDALIPSRLLAFGDFDDAATMKKCLLYLDSLSDVATGRKTRVQLVEADSKAKLVKLTHENFEVYRKSKSRFYDVVRCKYWAETKGKYDVNVKGYLDRWEKMRRAAIEGQKMKSGVARAVGEWEIAMDMWLSVIDDYEMDRLKDKEVKGGKEEAIIGEKNKLEIVRSNIMKALSSKRSLEEEGLEIIEDRSQLTTPSKNTQNNRIIPNSSKKIFTEQTRLAMKNRDQDMINSLKDMDSIRMDRWEGILNGVFANQSRSNTAEASQTMERVTAKSGFVRTVAKGCGLQDYADRNHRG